MSSVYDSLRDAGPYLGLGAQMAASFAVFVALGYWADHHFDSDPWFVLAGALLGFGAIAARVVQLVKRS